MAQDSAAQTRAKYASEFIGTFMLVLSVGCNVQTGSAVWAVTSIACTLMVSIYALGNVSGGHFNPAVSAVFAMLGKEDPKKMGLYMVTQIIAGIAAGLCYTMMFGSFNLAPVGTWWQAAAAEIIYTFMLCFVVLNTAAHPKHAGINQFYGLAIGFVVIAGGYASGHLSGGCFNPAVAFGIDVSSATKGFGQCLLYTVYEIIGAALAAGLYKVCRPDDFGGSANYSLAVRCISEFIGTYMLVVTVGLNVLGKSAAPVWSIAACLMCMIFALGSCSGAHFNPAVTVAILCRGGDRISPKDAGAFIVAQLVGGLSAAFTYVGLERGQAIPLAPGKGYGSYEAWTMELFFTFLLAFTVLCVATMNVAKHGDVFGLAIGSCVTAGGYAIGAISGGSLNPAVSLGLGVTGTAFAGGNLFHTAMYIVFELAAGALAAGVFKVTHPDAAEYMVKSPLPN